MVPFNTKETKSVPLTLVKENSYVSSPAGLTKANHSPPSCCLIPSEISLAIGVTPDWNTLKATFLIASNSRGSIPTPLAISL